MEPIDDRIDISDPMREIICERLGLEYNFVKELWFTPGEVTATVYLKDDKGKKYCVPTTETLPSDEGEVISFSSTPAVSFRHFRVKT